MIMEDYVGIAPFLRIWDVANLNVESHFLESFWKSARILKPKYAAIFVQDCMVPIRISWIMVFLYVNVRRLYSLQNTSCIFASMKNKCSWYKSDDQLWTKIRINSVVKVSRVEVWILQRAAGQWQGRNLSRKSKPNLEWMRKGVGKIISPRVKWEGLGTKKTRSWRGWSHVGAKCEIRTRRGSAPRSLSVCLSVCYVPY